MNINENQSKTKHYLVIVKTLFADPEQSISVVIKGNNGETEKLSLQVSQTYRKAFNHNQTDLFLLMSNVDVGKINQIEFYTNLNKKFYEWKFTNIFIIDGIQIYYENISEYLLLSSSDKPTIVNLIESEDNIYFVFIKTGDQSCSQQCFPKLSLFDTINKKNTQIDMNTSSINNKISFDQHQFDIFQWQDEPIGKIERICFQLCSEYKQFKCQWSIEWFFIVHHQYSFTGRITLNRVLNLDRLIDIDFQQQTSKITNEQGDSWNSRTICDNDIFPYPLLNQQANAHIDEIGRYYVIIRNIEGTNGNVYVNFHNDHLSSSGEQRLLKCENYPDHPFGSKHTDLFHVKATEISHIDSISLRLEQTNKDQSLTLDKLFIIHNSIVYHFDIKNIILNKDCPERKFIPRIQSALPFHKCSYYIAVHTSDKMLSRVHADLKVVVQGTNGMFGPVELKESLTNGNSPFEKECIDIFHLIEDDIGELISMKITLQGKGLMSHLFTGAKCDRIMLIKNGEYNSLWQIVGDLKVKESKTINFPIHQQRHSVEHRTLPVESLNMNIKHENPLLNSNDEINSIETKVHDYKETKLNVENIHLNDKITMIEIEDHQKRHAYAPNLYEAQKNYRELRRLLKKFHQSPTKIKKRHKLHKKH